VFELDKSILGSRREEGEVIEKEIVSMGGVNEIKKILSHGFFLGGLNFFEIRIGG
jgi:hypothetical protein